MLWQYFRISTATVHFSISRRATAYLILILPVACSIQFLLVYYFKELRPDHVMRFHVADVLLTDFGPPKKQQPSPQQQQQQLQGSGGGSSAGAAASSTALVAPAPSATPAPSALSCLPQLCPRLARLLVGVLMAHRGRLGKAGGCGEIAFPQQRIVGAALLSQSHLCLCDSLPFSPSLSISLPVFLLSVCLSVCLSLCLSVSDQYAFRSAIRACTQMVT